MTANYIVRMWKFASFLLICICSFQFSFTRTKTWSLSPFEPVQRGGKVRKGFYGVPLLNIQSRFFSIEIVASLEDENNFHE